MQDGNPQSRPSSAEADVNFQQSEFDKISGYILKLQYKIPSLFSTTNRALWKQKGGFFNKIPP